ncbi:M48 family metalloprotease [Streptomyces rugosispiralis]|uniref:M48 family metalloprotease n=1 Tax=Streptomyces rugosispiralis TaxID=2967341 RepID=A0ABT1URU9_9ACTN|nr:M48 family metalloprotease [Streptomyces rugosispiralis]MCQ8187066.1 M48 family metalloprotease [Streptomyces rugosispiralis]
MIYAVWLPPLIPLIAVPAARHAADRLAPRAAARLLVSCAVLLACSSTAALGALAALGLLRVNQVASAAGFSPEAPAGHTGPALWTAPVATILLIAGFAQVIRVAVRHHRELRSEQRAIGPTAGELTVHPDEYPYAYALPGRRGKPGTIVVSAAMLRSLRPDEREALFAHEREHLAGHHHRFLAAAQLAAVLHPALRALREPLAYALERRADEAAAHAVGDRKLAAKAIGRAALAARESKSPAARRGAILATVGGAVPRRVMALLQADDATQPARRRCWTCAVAVALLCCLALSAATGVDAVEDLHLNVAHGADPDRAASVTSASWAR